MGLLSGLLERARSLLAKPPPLGTARDAIAHGTLDEMLFEQMLEAAPPLRSLVHTLGVSHAGSEDFVRDALMCFYQPSPKQRNEPEMAPSRLRNWGAINALRDAPETETTRQYTVGDRYGATMATLSTASRFEELLRASEEIQEQCEKAEQAQGQQAEADDQLSQAMLAAVQAEQALAEGECDQHAMDAALTQLQLAVSESEFAAEAADIAAQQAQQAAAQASRRIAGQIAQASAEAGEELQQEAELLQSWGIHKGDVQYSSFTERQRLVRMLKASEVSRHLKLLGQFTYAERALRAKRVVPGRDEVYAIERSDRLGDVLASELGLMAHPDLELEFVSKLSEGQLLTRAYRGTEKVGKGPVVCCVDTSGSMKYGAKGVSPASWSKAFALALLQRCKADRRDFVGVLFSSRTQVQVFSFPVGSVRIEDVLEFVNKAFNGGTSFEAPLDKAMDIIERSYNNSGKKKGDIVFITDDNCAVTREWMASYRSRKAELGFRTWGIACGKRVPGSTLAELSDNVRAIDEFIDPTPVRDLLKAI